MTARSKGAVLFAKLASTREVIAQRLDVDESLVSRWRSGERVPSLPNRKLLHAAYGIAIEAWDQPPPGSDERTEPATTPPDWGSKTITARAEALEGIVAELMDRIGADTGATPLEKAKVAASLANTLSALRRLKGEDAAEIRVTRHPKWLELKATIVRALESHPDALEAVVEALSEESRKSA